MGSEPSWLGFVARDRSRGVRLPWFGVLARRDDGDRATLGDGLVALAGVEGTISGDAGDLLLGRDVVEQFRQHGRVAHIAGGEFSSLNLQRLLVNSDMDLAPDPPFRAAMLARIPLPFALDLDAGAVDQEVQRAC